MFNDFNDIDEVITVIFIAFTLTCVFIGAMLGSLFT